MVKQKAGAIDPSDEIRVSATIEYANELSFVGDADGSCLALGDMETGSSIGSGALVVC